MCSLVHLLHSFKAPFHKNISGGLLLFYAKLIVQQSGEKRSEKRSSKLSQVLNEKDVADNKNLWKTVKPLLSDKIKSNEKITIVGDDKIFTQEIKVAEELNSFFSNVVKNLKIPEYIETKPLAEEILITILK